MSLYTTVELPVEVTGEKLQLLSILHDQRNMFLLTLRNLTDEQARQATTVSTLTLGGLLKHLTWGERDSATTVAEPDENATFDMELVANAYELTGDESFEAFLTEFEARAREFDEAVAATDLDTLIPMPTAPWAPEREWQTVREILVHKIRETAHHSGHADIIREALDGQTTMGVLAEGQPWADSF